MTRLYVVTKDWNEREPRVSSIVVKETAHSYIFKDGSSRARAAFGFRSRWDKEQDSVALSRDEAINNYMHEQEEIIMQAEADIAEAEVNLRALTRGIK